MVVVGCARVIVSVRIFSMPKKKRFRSRYQGGSDDMAVSGPNSRPRGKRSRQGSGGGGRRSFNGPRLGPDGQPIVGEPE